MKKFKIIEERPEVSDEIINKAKDFDGLLAAHTSSTGGSSFKMVKSLALTATVLLVSYLAIVYFFIQGDEEADKLEEVMVLKEAEQWETKDAKELNTNNKVVEDESKQVGVATKPAIEQPSEVKEEYNEQAVETVKKGVTPDEQKGGEPLADKEGSPSYEYIEAEPLAGITALYDYFDRTLKYPDEALPDSVEGVTLVTFTINKNGSAEQIVIEKSLGQLFDMEAERLIKQMPEWRPASINGQSIDSKVSIPLTFQIQD